MVCILCGRTALYQAQGAGFCGAHKREATDATAKDKRLIMARYGAENYRPEVKRGTPAHRESWRGFSFED